MIDLSSIALFIAVVIIASILLVTLRYWMVLFVIYGIVFSMDLFMYHGQLNLWLYIIPPFTLHVLGIRSKVNKALEPQEDQTNVEVDCDQMKREIRPGVTLTYNNEVNHHYESGQLDEKASFSWKSILRREFKNPIKSGYSIVSLILLINYYLGGV